VSPTDLAFENKSDGVGVLVGLRLDDGVGVGGFPLDVGGDAAIREAC
jgi:hypothetical protein